MTNEEIEAARGSIVKALSCSEQEAFDALDALCAAARQPESLVGRRVRLREAFHGITKTARVEAVSYFLNPEHEDDPEFRFRALRTDFELLEADDAE